MGFSVVQLFFENLEKSGIQNAWYVYSILQWAEKESVMSVQLNTNCSNQKHESGLDQRTDDLQSRSNEQLLLDLEALFTQERKTTHQILLHLKEIRSRRLYAERGYPNLFSMLVQHFHQSESAANQRLKALELMLDVPAVEERLVSGDLTLSTVAMAQRQIRREEKILGKKISKEKN